jgi:hypothetical protein
MHEINYCEIGNFISTNILLANILFPLITFFSEVNVTLVIVVG